MDALGVLIDCVSVFGQLTSRCAEKEESLAELAAHVRSISQSVGSFAATLDAEERIAVYDSNQVFPQVISQLEKCYDVLKSDGAVGQLEQEPQQAQQQLQDGGHAETSVLSSIRRGLRQGSRTLHEGLQMISSNIGNPLSGMLGLPEDKLAAIRQTADELNKLVPQLNLAIQVYSVNLHKRTAEAAGLSVPAPPLKVARPSTASSEAGGGPRRLSSVSLGDASHTAADLEKVPLLNLALVSESKASHLKLPKLTTRDLRLGTTAASTSSLESIAGDHVQRVCFGRQELSAVQVLRGVEMPCEGGAPVSIVRFVSRDAFALLLSEVQAPQLEETLDMATLALGGGFPTEDFGGATLAMGCSPPRPRLQPSPVASAVGLAAGGLHVRRAGQARWCWSPKDRTVEVFHGDCLGVLLTSPPDSFKPAPTHDLEGSEVELILGLVVHQPDGLSQ